jgi:uncharacterized SAM-binding protein YcdF (DUF218 family)
MENLEFANELYDLRDKKLVVVSSDYHMFRALAIARKMGYTDVSGLPCQSRITILPVYLLREYSAVMYYALLGRI